MNDAVHRGALVTIAARGAHSGKPRPALIVQSDHFAQLGSVAVCLLSTERIDAPLLRLDLEPDDQNGLGRPCQIMIDKMVTLPRTAIGQRIGILGTDDLVRVDRALALYPRDRLTRRNPDGPDNPGNSHHCPGLPGSSLSLAAWRRLARQSAPGGLVRSRSIRLQACKGSRSRAFAAKAAPTREIGV